MRRFITATILASVAALGGLARAAQLGAEPPVAATATTGDAAVPVRAPDPHPDLVRLAPSEEVWIDRAQKEVVVGGQVVLDEGAIEVFACPRHTKEHEAVIATNSSARLVHAALLAVGLDPGRPVAFHPDYREAAGPAVTIRVRWRDADGMEHDRPAQEWIRNTKTGKALDADWVFTGSEFWRDPQGGREHYQADGGDLVCVSNFPTATLDLPIESSQANDALLFDIFPDRVPPRGTRVELVLSAKR